MQCIVAGVGVAEGVWLVVGLKQILTFGSNIFANTPLVFKYSKMDYFLYWKYNKHCSHAVS